MRQAWKTSRCTSGQKELPGWRKGRKLNNSSFVNKVKIIDLGFMKTLNLGMLHIQPGPSLCRAAGIRSDKDKDKKWLAVIMITGIDSTRQLQPQLKALLSWLLHKHRKMTVSAPAEPQGKKKETSRYIRAQRSDIRVFLNVLCTTHQRPQTGHFPLMNEHLAAIAQLFNILPMPTSENFHPKGETSYL